MKGSNGGGQMVSKRHVKPGGILRTISFFFSVFLVQMKHLSDLTGEEKGQRTSQLGWVCITNFDLLVLDRHLHFKFTIMSWEKSFNTKATIKMDFFFFFYKKEERKDVFLQKCDDLT